MIMIIIIITAMKMVSTSLQYSVWSMEPLTMIMRIDDDHDHHNDHQKDDYDHHDHHNYDYGVDLSEVFCLVDGAVDDDRNHLHLIINVIIIVIIIIIAIV